jgi:hypothetical protein
MNQDQFMKNKFLLLALASLVLVTAQAGATTKQQDVVTIELPTYVVESPRYLPAEKNIEAGLSELRGKSQAPAITLAELPSLRSKATPAFNGRELKTAQQQPAAVKLAKS